MKDQYRKLMRRSFRDAFSIKEDVEDEFDVHVSESTFSRMALGLYTHRVQRYNVEREKAEQEAKQQMPEGSPDAGKW